MKFQCNFIFGRILRVLFRSVKDTLEASGYKVEATIGYVPKNTVRVTGKDAERLLTLLNALEDMDDVQEVFSNFEMDDAEMEALLAQLGQ